ncbi:MAG: hypothetical protein ACOCXF_03665 [bacterium]
MRFLHRTAMWLCLILVVSLVMLSGCASSSAAEARRADRQQTAETDKEAGQDESTTLSESAASDAGSAGDADGSAGEDAGSDDGKQTIELPPSREIPDSQLMELVGQNVPERFIFLSDNDGNPLRIYHDLDQNGYEDIFLLLVEFPEDDGRDSPRTGDSQQIGRVSSLQSVSTDSAEQPVEQTGETDTGDTGQEGRLAQASEEDSEEDSEDSQSLPGISPELELKPEEPQPDAIIHDRKVAASDLADMSRLFSEEIRPHKFYLAFFLRTPDGLVSMYRIPLGSWFVFEDFQGYQLNDRRAMPYAVSISFQTHEGKESQWVCFSDYNQFSFFTLKNSISVTSEIRDINDNGFVDILEWRKVFEEGTGYETFLTWYKWDGKKYAQHETSNIVRNLNQFLHNTSTLLSLGKWSQAFSLVLPDEQYRSLMDKNISFGSLFIRLFPSQPERDETESIDDAQLKAKIDQGERVFNSVIVPRVLENPFAGEKQGIQPDYRTRFSIRFILRDGSSSVRECSIRMNENPFADAQYFIEPQQ